MRYQKHNRILSIGVLALLCLFSNKLIADDQHKNDDDHHHKLFRAGVSQVDVTPTQFPVIVNGYFQERSANRASDRVMSRAIVLDDGKNRIALVVVDNLMIPRVLLDDAKEMAQEATGIPVDRIMISATHTHSAPSAMACLGSRADPKYVQFLPEQIAKSIIQANEKLIPAKIGWTVVQDREHNHCRRWIFRPDQIQTDPFGKKTMRAHMHPGHLSPKHVAPSGPADHDFSLLAIKTNDDKTLAVMGNYAFHFYGSNPVSGDACGLFGDQFKSLLNQDEVHSKFVGILSQGTSGDAAWMDYSQPAGKRDLTIYTKALAETAFTGFQKIQFFDWVPLSMAEETIRLKRRIPDEERLKWAQETVKKLEGKIPTKLPDIYAQEQLDLHHEPEVELKLQAIGIGDFGITTLPNEVYAITGLKLKEQSPFKTTMNIELANGAQGYIPPPEQHHLGGYTTWPAKTAGLEVQAEPKIVETLLGLLEKVSGKPRKEITVPETAYSKSVISSQPVSYWRMEELSLDKAHDLLNTHDAEYEPGVAHYLPGPVANGISTGSRGNRAAHFAGGRMKSEIPDLKNSYSVEFWFWNGLPHDARAVTGYLFSRGKDGDTTASGDHLGIGGTYQDQTEGKLIFFNGNRERELLIGKSLLQLRSWNHVVLVRDKNQVTIYLNGDESPEISGEIGITYPAGTSEIFLGGRNDMFASFEGKIDEVAIYDRVLTPKEVGEHFRQSGIPKPKLIQTSQTTPKPDVPPLSPEESLAEIRVKDGYEVELVASEPMVIDPVFLSWDAEGKLWVAEMSDYPYGMDGKGKPGGRIRVLEDTDRDGKMDRSRIFLEDISFPNGLLPWKDGVLITSAPNILYASDNDGDGKADDVKVLFSGFQEINQQLRVNGLRWGLDNWIYCASGANHAARKTGKIQSTKTGKSVVLGSRDFRIRPETGELDPQSGPSQFGRNRDDWGNWYGVQNSYPLWHYALKDHYIRRNPHIAPPDPRIQLRLPSNPKVYPAKTPQKRFHSFEQSGRFTSACSAMIYRDRLLFPESKIQHGFTCEPFHNLVQHSHVREDGISFQANRADDEPEHDFFASRDRWCRPVMTTTGPDGALWVADMYRYMIEHPDWLTPEGRAELKPFYRHGDDRGRIYRIYPKGKKPVPMANLNTLSNSELVKHLETPNGTQRDLIQQLLISRKDPSVNVLLIDLLAGSEEPLARLHALCTLDGLGVITPEILLTALSDPHPGVQKHAIRISEPYVPHYPELLKAALELKASPNAKVRLQLACSIGEWRDPKSAKALAAIMVRDQNDPYLLSAAMSSVSDSNIDPLLHSVLESPGDHHEITSQLISQSIAFDHPNATLNSLKEGLNPEQPLTSRFHLAAGFFKALKTHGKSVEPFFGESQKQILKRLLELTNQARETLRKENEADSVRVAAIGVLGQFPNREAEDIELLAGLLNPQTSSEVQIASVEHLSSFSNQKIANLFLENWPAHAPAVRSRILENLTTRDPWSMTLLDHLEKEQISPSEIDVVTRQKLLASKNKQIQKRVQTLLKTLGNPDRQLVVKQFHNVLQLKGDPGKGKEVFKKKCSICHQLEKVGFEVGPNLASLTDKRPETLLTAILNPSAAVDSKFLTYTAMTEEGRIYSGILSSETGNSITLLMQENRKQVILRKQIDEIRSTGKSMMPDGLEKETSAQDFADLISYLRSDQLK